MFDVQSWQSMMERSLSLPPSCSSYVIQMLFMNCSG